jgi:outer membrane protein assembly factor BamB
VTERPRRCSQQGPPESAPTCCSGDGRAGGEGRTGAASSGLLLIACVVAAVLVFSGVADAVTAIPRTSPPKSSPVDWATSDLVAEGPTVSGSFVLVTVKIADSLAEFAVNPLTGKTKWGLPTTLSAIPAATAAPPIVIGGVLLFLTPQPKYFNGFGAGIEGVSAVTGARMWSEKGAFAVLDAPSVCPGPSGGTDFCVILEQKPGGSLILAVIDAAKGSVLAEYTGVARHLGASLYETTAQPPALVSFDVPGGFGWTRRLSAVFGSTAYDPNYGWQLADSGGLYVLTVNHVPSRQHQELAAALTVGLSASTGSTLWRDDGAFRCNGVVLVEASYLCQEKGTISLSSSGKPVVSSASAELVGLNPATGHLTWRFGVGDVADFLNGDGVAFAAATQVVVPDDTGSLELLGLDAGRRSSLRSDPALWCPTPRSFLDPTVAAAALVRVAPESFTSCDSRRRPTERPTGAAPPDALVVAGERVWVTSSGLAGIPAG